MAITLTKETGAGVTGANTYINADDFENYCDARGLSYSGYTGDQEEEAILRGMDFIESLLWKGSKTDDDQALKWPRIGMYDGDGISIDNDTIPTGVVNAACRAAYEELVDSGCLNKNLTRDDKVKREKVDVIDTEYFEFTNRDTEWNVILSHCEEFLKTSSSRTLLRC